MLHIFKLHIRKRYPFLLLGKKMIANVLQRPNQNQLQTIPSRAQGWLKVQES